MCGLGRGKVPEPSTGPASWTSAAGGCTLTGVPCLIHTPAPARRLGTLAPGPRAWSECGEGLHEHFLTNTSS